MKLVFLRKENSTVFILLPLFATLSDVAHKIPTFNMKEKIIEGKCSVFSLNGISQFQEKACCFRFHRWKF
jgi:hypothetical protein